MPALVNSRIDARSKELTKNLVHTRHQLENHFKSIKRRERDFKIQKLANFEEELKATARMARAAAAAEEARASSGTRRKQEPPREQSRSSPRRSKSLERQQTWTGAGSAGGQAGSLSRSWSSPDGWPNTYPPQFPDQWFGYGVMPKPPGEPAKFPLAVTRHCADVPAVQHPPPHPGARSMSPARTRSLAAFATSYTAAAYSPTPLPMVAAPRSPLTPPPRRQPVVERSLGNTSGSKETDEDASPLSGGGPIIGNDPMITRLGHYMALLGPRYKCCNKEMIWEKAEHGEKTPAQRRLLKLGGIEACGGGPDLSLRASAPDLGQDSDGKARAAWLAARTADRERRNRAARSSAAGR